MEVYGWQFNRYAANANNFTRPIPDLNRYSQCYALHHLWKCIGVANFPTLNNAGEALRVYAPGNQLIDSVNFNLGWYADEDKQAGGWTLELIDVNNSCGEENNWTASEAAQGGTPGAVNSVNANKPDLTGPRLLAVAVITDSELLLTFDEKLEKPITAQLFSIVPDVAITSAQLVVPSLRQIKLLLSGNLQPKQLYILTIAGLRDCAGNEIQQTHNQKNLLYLR